MVGFGGYKDWIHGRVIEEHQKTISKRKQLHIPNNQARPRRFLTRLEGALIRIIPTYKRIHCQFNLGENGTCASFNQSSSAMDFIKHRAYISNLYTK